MKKIVPPPSNSPLDQDITPESISFHDIIAPVHADFAAVDAMIQASLQSDVPLIAEINAYLINSGGKRLRPLIALLCGQVMGSADDARQHKLATAVEFLHNATLLHDDVVDSSNLRRGRKTTHTVWGNATSILVGDFLISRSLQLLTQIDSMPILRVFAETTNLIAEGEVLQLLHCKNPETSLAQYQEVIKRKTAAMFEAAARGAAMIANCPSAVVTALSAFATHLGNAFQMVDDALDYGSSSEPLGKNIGDDLAEGKITLPLLLALQQADPNDAAFLRKLLSNTPSTGDQSDKSSLLQGVHIVRNCGGVTGTLHLAAQEINHALSQLSVVPPSPSTTALAQLAHFTLQRQQ